MHPATLHPIVDGRAAYAGNCECHIDRHVLSFALADITMEYGHVGTSRRQGSQGGKGYAVGPYISELSININVHPTILIHARVPDTFQLGAISELSDFCASRFFNKFRVFSGLEYSDSLRRHHL